MSVGQKDILPIDGSGSPVSNGIVEVVEGIIVPLGGALTDGASVRVQIPPTGRFKRITVAWLGAPLPNNTFDFRIAKAESPAADEIHFLAEGEINLIDEVLDMPYTQDDTLAWFWVKSITAGTDVPYSIKLLIERNVRVSVR